MKFRGAIVDLLIKSDPTCADFVICERGQKVLHVVALKAAHGMLQSSLLLHKKLKADLIEIGFKFNPCDPCAANRLVDAKQQTAALHAGDVKSSRVDSRVNDKFHDWLEEKCGDKQIGQVKSQRGKRFDCLGMALDFTEKGKLKLSMVDCAKAMVEDFPEGVAKMIGSTPWSGNLFKVDKSSKPLPRDKAEEFHTFTAKGSLSCKRARQGAHPAIALFATRVHQPTEQDWCKLKKVLAFMSNAATGAAALSADDSGALNWRLGAALAAHPGMRSRAGATAAAGRGSIQSTSAKQKTSTRSSTEAELAPMDGIIAKAARAKQLLERQGRQASGSTAHRGNQSAMKLESSGKSSSGKRARHFDAKHFCTTGLAKREEASLKPRPAGEAAGGRSTKPLAGAKLRAFRKAIAGL